MISRNNPDHRDLVRAIDHYPVSRRERFEAWIERQNWFVQMLVYLTFGCLLGLLLGGIVVIGRVL
jgi:hypothetical protein